MMRKRLRPLLACLALVIIAGMGYGQPADTMAMRYAATITEDELMKHLTIIAGDAFEGREAGMHGQRMAAAYLRDRFKEMGIPEVPDWKGRGMVEGYYQPFILRVKRPGGIVCEVDGLPYRFMDGMFYNNERSETDVLLQGSVVIVPSSSGTVAIPDEAEVEGQAVLVVDERFGEADAAVYFERASKWGGVAQERGAKVLFYWSPAYDRIKEQYGHYLAAPRMELDKDPDRQTQRKGIQIIMAGPRMADAMLSKAGTDRRKALKRTGKRAWVTRSTASVRMTSTPLVSRLVSENVLAYIEGTDLRDELVIITAHYDHIGMEEGEVYNGADDDGSGTVALLEIAEAFSLAKAAGQGPRRSVLIMPVSAEEKGLLGSRYYSEEPVFPLENTIANLNIDMIGRYDSAHAESPPYVYIIGSDRLSSELHAINEWANEAHVGLVLDMTFNAPDDPNRFYYRSDHYNFASKGVPAIFYFSGVHEDYHGPGDEVDKIVPHLLEQRTRLVFHTAWELANRPQRIVVDRDPQGR